MAAGARRRRRRVGVSGEEAAPDWAALNVDLMQLIASRVLATGGFLDYVRFRAVCPHWRAAAASPRGRGLLDPRLHPRRWMLFPEGFGRFPGHSLDGGHARFFDLSAAGAFVRVPIPELENHCVLDSPDGLLLLQRDADTAVRLLHPFTGDIAEFPSLDCLARQLTDLDDSFQSHYNFPGWLHSARRLQKVRKICAAVSVTATGVVTVMLALDRIGRVAFASAGDYEWTISSWTMTQLDRALSYQGKLYVMNCEDGLTHVSLIDPPLPRYEGEESPSEQTLPPPRTVATCSSNEIYLPSMVELDSEIMLVGYNDSSFSRILVLKLADLVLGRIVPVASIGDHVLFAGARSFCVSSSWLPSIGGNSIVCFHAGEILHNTISALALGHRPAMDTSCLAPHRVPVASYITSLPVAIGDSAKNKGLMFYNKEPEWWAMRSSRYGGTEALRAVG
ncbi:hypothetical protein ACP70R_014405 [Stipagrostis hirtigluma subsp. patula]